MTTRLLSLCLLVAAGCGGNGTPPDQIDAPAAVLCTGAIYDPCTTAAQCMSMNCHNYSGNGFQVCTQTCSSSNPCPMQDGVAVACNGMGNCKPPLPTACNR